MKAMGIDYGLKRIGIAFSDETKFLATPYEVYNTKTPQEDISYLLLLIKNNKVDEIVCGLPLNTQGEEQEIAKQTKVFIGELQKQSGVKIQFVDERYSSVVAQELLSKREKDWKKRKQKLDAVAASIILQDYLDRRVK